MQRRGFVLPAHYSVVPLTAKVGENNEHHLQRGRSLGGSARENPKASRSTASMTPRRKKPLVASDSGRFHATGDSAEPPATEVQRFPEEARDSLPPLSDRPSRAVLLASQPKTKGLPSFLAKRRMQTNRQANRVLLNSLGHLLDKASMKFDEKFPGQTPSELALLPPPFINIWNAMEPTHRPDPKILTSWMAERGLRMNEAFSELVLTDGFPSLLEPWPETLHKGRQSSWLYSPTLDNPQAKFDLATWIDHVLQQREMYAEADDIRRVDGPALDIRWVIAMLLWIPAAENVNMSKLPFELKHGFLGFLPLLRILDLSENRLLQSEHLKILVNCPALEQIDVSRCERLRTLKHLGSCRRLKTIRARDCLGFQATEAETEPLISSTSVTSIDMHECDGLICLTIELPAVKYLDLAYYDVLERVRGKLMGLERLDMSFNPLTYHIIDDLFHQCAPNLLELHLRSCDTLEKIDGLCVAQKLRVLRVCCCPTLRTLGFNPKEVSMKPTCPMLQFLDAHDCPMLLERQIWETVKQRVTSAPPSEAEDSTQKKLLKDIGSFTRGDVVSVEDFWIHEEGSSKRLKYLCKSTKGITDFLYADRDGEDFTSVSSEEEDQLCAVVWPSKAQADKFRETLSAGQGKNFTRATLAGVRRKLRDAVEFGREHPEPRREEAKEELDHAITRMIEVLRPQDFALLRGAMCKGAVPELLPDRQIACFLGCGKMMSSGLYPRHECYECPARRIFVQRTFVVPRIGGAAERVPNEVGICMSDIAAFNSRADALEKGLKTWNPKPLHDILTEIDNANPQYFTEATRNAAWGRQRRLEEKYKVVHPLLKKGNIHVDFDHCTVDILVSISFAARKPPDASAAFDEKGYSQAQEVLKDLSVVVGAYRTPMIVEGHTGQVEPRAYWEELAQNRSTLIVQNLQMLGVPEGLCRPLGCPGGGAKVLVYADKATKTD